MSKKLMTLDETAGFLGLKVADVEKLRKRGALSAYKIGGSLIRFERTQVEEYKQQLERKSSPTPERSTRSTGAGKSVSLQKPGVFDKIVDFILFNDFYIICAVFIIFFLLFLLN